MLTHTHTHTHTHTESYTQLIFQTIPCSSAPSARERPSLKPAAGGSARTSAARERTARASAGPVFKGVCKQFSRSQGHGFITPENGSEDIFVHVSDIEGEYVPVEGDEVTYKMCPIPPKNQKFQAVEVVLTQLAPHTPHETWSGQVVGS
ncbi:cold shock domain-containing protein C2 isoform X2 [Pseudorca crassidens]|uniref:cold shock domain-containing protein C2 isoform X2 n=1 Tax=Pseudorca crassidens TaxID=82174 RepID=UPI00352D7FC8